MEGISLKFAIIAGKDTYYDVHFVEPLQQTIRREGFVCDRLTEGNVELLEGYDVAYMMMHGPKFDFERWSQRTPIINAYSAQEIAMNKIKSNELFKKNNISHPFFELCSNKRAIDVFMSTRDIAMLKYPYDCAGNKHFVLMKEHGNYVAYNNEGKYDIVEKERYVEIGDSVIAAPYLLQEYIGDNGDFNKSVLRMYVLGDEVPFGTIREKEHVNTPGEAIINIARGAHYVFMEPSEDLRRIALQAADAVGFDIGVVDIVQDHERNNYVIECDCDGRYGVIDRKFFDHPDFENMHDFNRLIGRRLMHIAQGKKYRM